MPSRDLRSQTEGEEAQDTEESQSLEAEVGQAPTQLARQRSVKWHPSSVQEHSSKVFKTTITRSTYASHFCGATGRNDVDETLGLCGRKAELPSVSRSSVHVDIQVPIRVVPSGGKPDLDALWITATGHAIKNRRDQWR